MAFAENMVEQDKISTTSNVPGSPGVDIGPSKDGEPGCYEIFPQYRVLVESLMRLPVITRPDIPNVFYAFARHSYNPSPRH